MKPTHKVVLSYRPPDAEKSINTTIGAGWKNKAGGINLRIRSGLQLVVSDNTQLVVWPSDEYRGGGGGRGGGDDHDYQVDPNDDIPF